MDIGLHLYAFGAKAEDEEEDERRVHVPFSSRLFLVLSLMFAWALSRSARYS